MRKESRCRVCARVRRACACECARRMGVWTGREGVEAWTLRHLPALICTEWVCGPGVRRGCGERATREGCG